MLSQYLKYSKIRTFSHRTPTHANKVTKGNKSLNWLRKFILYFKYIIINIIFNKIIKIVGLIPLILDINNSVDILNLITNVEEHNLEFVEELNIAM